MYGLVNKAIKDLVVENHGREIGEQIFTEVGFVEKNFTFIESAEKCLVSRIMS